MKPITDFCIIPNEELMKILDFCGVIGLVEISEMEESIRGGKCVEKKWSLYDTIIVTPKEIKFTKSPYPTQTIMTTEKYNKLV